MQKSTFKDFLKDNWVWLTLGGVTLAGAYLLKKRYHANHLIQLKKTHKFVGVKREFLENPYNPDEIVYIKDLAFVRQKVEALTQAGSKELQIIIDFDQTITAFNHNGKPAKSCFDIYDDVASEKFLKAQLATFEYYYPLEKDPNIPREEKIKLMEAWWKKEEELLLEEKFTKDTLKRALEITNIGLRYGFSSFIRLCEEAKLPVFVVSGGVLDIIGTILRQFIPDLETNDLIKIYSNVMDFDENGVFKGFELPHIHSLHKENILDRNNPDFNFRKNAILIGDSVNDRYMANKIGCETLLTIGFLNPKYENRIEEYQSLYDIVIFGDGNFTQIEALIRSIVGKPQPEEISSLLKDSSSSLKPLLSF